MSRAAGQAALNQVKVKLAGGRLSDHLSLIGAYNHWQAAGGASGQRSFCRRNFLSEATMRHIFGLRKQLRQKVVQLGFAAENNFCAANPAVVMAVIAAGLYPHVAVLKPGRTNLSCRNENRVKIHISSLNFKQGGGRGGGGGGQRTGGELTYSFVCLFVFCLLTYSFVCSFIR